MTSPASGAWLFLRYAYPPNALGFCGPADSGALLQYGQAGVVDPDLVRLVRGFSGAWPYLELIAGATGIGDPLDHRVVSAYWEGNRYLDTMDVPSIAGPLAERFRPIVGRRFTDLVDTVLAGAVPNHGFHVFCVYPWLHLLGDDRAGPQALTVLDRCRIRWGQVVSTHGDQAVVRSRALRFDGRWLYLAEPDTETAKLGIGGLEVAAGQWVSLHWDWVCDRLTPRRLRFLRHHTRRQLDIVNHRVARSGPAAVLA
ncbi:MAG: DUF6390 family protein [Pseudonocardiaceae bacterium]|nr:DUF6390 family protein [Pseudonocardiaceae bacterium]